jgi:hypothetical protein
MRTSRWSRAALSFLISTAVTKSYHPHSNTHDYLSLYFLPLYRNWVQRVGIHSVPFVLANDTGDSLKKQENADKVQKKTKKKGSTTDSKKVKKASLESQPEDGAETKVEPPPKEKKSKKKKDPEPAIPEYAIEGFFEHNDSIHEVGTYNKITHCNMWYFRICDTELVNFVPVLSLFLVWIVTCAKNVVGYLTAAATLILHKKKVILNTTSHLSKMYFFLKKRLFVGLACHGCRSRSFCFLLLLSLLLFPRLTRLNTCLFLLLFFFLFFFCLVL